MCIDDCGDVIVINQNKKDAINKNDNVASGICESIFSEIDL